MNENTFKTKLIKGLKWFFFSFIWLAIILFVIDIVTKQVVMNNVALNDWSKRISLIPSDGSFLAITYVQNTGMAFGINFNNDIANAVFFISVSVIGAALITFFYIKLYKKTGLFVKACLMLLLCGCIGNLIDRAFYVDSVGRHFVVDWIAFFGEKGFPRFNIADSCLTIGAIMLIVYLIVKEVKEDMAKAKKDRKKEIEAGHPNIDSEEDKK